MDGEELSDIHKDWAYDVMDKIIEHFECEHNIKEANYLLYRKKNSERNRASGRTPQ